MLRYLSPTLFFAAAIYAYWHNTTDGNSLWILPFMDVIWPETANNLTEQGNKSVIVLIVMGCALVVLQVFKDRGYRRKLSANFQDPQR